MVDEEISSEAARLLSVAIGMIMEDHADSAVSTLSDAADDRRQHFQRLGQAGLDIAALATAADVLLRLGSRECSYSSHPS
jgi:hypothetical protein